MAEEHKEQPWGFYKENLPDWLQFFTSQWLNRQPSTKMKYLEGWGHDSPQEINYNVPLAFLTNMREGVQWQDPGPAGARWHGASKTPWGSWLKEPWHPTHHYEDEYQLKKKLQDALKLIAGK